MSEVKHTPGPWTLETVRTSSGLCHKIGPFPWKTGKENHACIYDDYPSHGSDGTPELLANAHLIAAAPEMLEALIRALNYIENTEGEFGSILSSGEACRAAIEKAEGRS